VASRVVCEFASMLIALAGQWGKKDLQVFKK
jgi:hypothetical protein